MVRAFNRLTYGYVVLMLFSDVADVAWSPGDRFIASVGLNSVVMVWCTHGQLHSWYVGTMFLRPIHSLNLSLFNQECQETVFLLPSNIHPNSVRHLAKYLTSFRFYPRKRCAHRQLLERCCLRLRLRSHFMGQARRSLVCRRFRCMARSTTRQFNYRQSGYLDFHREQYCGYPR